METIQAVITRRHPDELQAARPDSANRPSAASAPSANSSPVSVGGAIEAARARIEDEERNRFVMGRARKVEGVWQCCETPMAVRPLSNWRSSLRCELCGNVTDVNEYPSEVADPFSCDSPLQALNEYQTQRLLGRWKQFGFGSRYGRGLWSQCPLRDLIAEWNERTDAGLLISGSMGTGKTVAMGLMMACLAARNEFSFCFYHVSSLLTLLHSWQEWGANYGDDYLLKELRSCKYLFLDDLGVEYNSPLAMSRFHEMVEVRYSRELLFVATSNLSETALCEREGWKRIVDRVQENALDWIELGGESKRRSTPL